MTLSLKTLLLTATMAICVPKVTLAATMPDKDDEARQNPTLEAGNQNAKGLRSYINYDANHIIMNGRDWTGLARTLTQSVEQHKPVNIVHIGDSHIQAEGATSRIRAALQLRFGNGGRGLMIPFKIAGTNQPLDYRITVDSPATTATLMRMPWATTMGFTGISIAPKSNHTQFVVQPETQFSAMVVYGTGDYTIENVTTEGMAIDHTTEVISPGVTKIAFSSPVRDARITFEGDNYNIFGFEARGNEQQGGVLYHAIGNNGAAYRTYLKVGNMGQSLRNMHPQLVIISLGANEAFGNISDEAFYNNIDKLVSEIKRENPFVEILLTTPSECQRSSYITSRTKKTKRKRSSTQRIRTYQINPNVERLRNVILRYGKEKGVAVYDFYDVAGGEGSSAKWLADGLLSSDRIHRTWAGYRTEGDLLAEALNEALVYVPEKKTTKSGIRTATPDGKHQNRNRKYSTKAKTQHTK